MAENSLVFYAYPSQDPGTSNTIEAACANVNKSLGPKIQTWRDLGIAGLHVIDEILTAIDSAAAFACDMSTPNPNVMFELGYALAKSKRIWISLDPSKRESRSNYRRLGSVSGIGYTEYTNTKQLTSRLYKDKPWINNVDPEFIFASSQESESLFYVKSPIDTDGSISLTDAVGEQDLFTSILYDDPTETLWQPVGWYLKSIRESAAVVLHVVGNDRSDYETNTLRSALIAGVSRGIGKPTLILAPHPYDPPFDFQHVLKVYSTAAQCASQFSDWLFDLRQSRTPASADSSQRGTHTRGTRGTKVIEVGESVAENETHDLIKYFVPTSAYRDVLDGRSNLFVGRKGTGKTAVLTVAAAKLRSDQRNVVCVIMPAGYELDGILKVLGQNIDRAEKGYLVESLWKFLILTQLGVSLAQQVELRPAHFHPTDADKALIKFVQQNPLLFDGSFSARMQSAIESLVSVDQVETAPGQRARISELLHNHILARLQALLRAALSSRKQVSIMVDNLDKNWERGTDIYLLVELISGLISVSNRLVEEFLTDRRNSPAVMLNLSIFLRSDIFAVLKANSGERDKIRSTKLLWNDHEQLARVIDARIHHSLSGSQSLETIWKNHFVETISDIPTRTFLVESVLPRPRDVIFMVNEALSVATNRGHAKVTEEDILTAVSTYSQFAFDALVAQDDPKLGRLEELLIEFAGCPSVLVRDQVEKFMDTAGLDSALKIIYFDKLLDLGFLGFVEKDDTLYFVADDEDRRIQSKIHQKAAVNRSVPERFSINKAFHSVLQVAD